MAYRSHAMICTCTNCISNGALKIKDALEVEIIKKGIEKDIQIVQTGASGLYLLCFLFLALSRGWLRLLLEIHFISMQDLPFRAAQWPAGISAKYQTRSRSGRHGGVYERPSGK